jgi:Tetratricopeptide repeat
MRATFYIHIGVHKTGTKSIQYTCSENRDKLLEHGINYLPGDPNHGPPLISLFSDHPHEDIRNIMRHVDTPEKAASLNASTRYEITKALRRNRSPKMVISGEGLSSLLETEIERLKQMLSPYATAYRIIVYVRDPYEYCNSAYLQRLKSGGVLGAADRKMPRPHYRRRIERYINVFGRENIDIRVFNPRRFIGGELVTDFLVAIGESAELARSLKIVRANQSMSHEAAMILSETNKAIPRYINGRANRAYAFGFHPYIVGIEGEKFTIDPSEYLKYEDELRADIEWLAQVMGERVFDLTAPRPVSEPRWSEVTVRSIKKVLSEMVAQLQRLERDRRLPPIPRPALPAGLEWLQDAYGIPTAGQTERQPVATPHFDQASIQTLGCFLHAVALTTQLLKAARAARRGRFLIWISRRWAENHFREVVRLNPNNATAQYRLSQAHLLRGHFVEARKTAETAARLEPNRARFRRWLRLANMVERWLIKQSPVPAEPVKLRVARRGAGPARVKRQSPRPDRPPNAGRRAKRTEQV